MRSFSYVSNLLATAESKLRPSCYPYRFSFGWAPDTGLYDSIGFGLGYAKAVGVTFPGYGGCVYQPWRD
jgi:hypothetical protein